MTSKFKEFFPKGRVNVKLSPFTSFKIGGPARFFYEAKTKKDLISAVKKARKLKLAYFLLGEGTNLLVSDKGFDGLVIKVANKSLKVRGEKISVEAGTLLSTLVKKTGEKSLTGLEFCFGIPGTVGGAIFGNAGSGENWIGGVVLEVKVLDKKGRIKKIPQRDCHFSYRQSRFQTSGEVILEAVIGLKKANKKEIEEKMAFFLEKRKRQPRESSAGSVFKNPPQDSAGRLIQACGLKGKRIGNAQISPLHANFIVNLGDATCRDVLKLILLAKKRVREKFGVELEEEIRIIGR